MIDWFSIAVWILSSICIARVWYRYGKTVGREDMAETARNRLIGYRPNFGVVSLSLDETDVDFIFDPREVK